MARSQDASTASAGRPSTPPQQALKRDRGSRLSRMQVHLWCRQARIRPTRVPVENAQRAH